jgi:DNA-binding NtrC family response regulator
MRTLAVTFLSPFSGHTAAFAHIVTVASLITSGEPVFAGQGFTKSIELKLKERPKLAADAINMLIAYDWPSNVQELENAIERALIQHRAGAPLSFEALLSLMAPGRIVQGQSRDEPLVSLDEMNARLYQAGSGESRRPDLWAGPGGTDFKHQPQHASQAHEQAGYSLWQKKLESHDSAS